MTVAETSRPAPSEGEVVVLATNLHAAAERLLTVLYPHRHELADAQPAIAELAVRSMHFGAAEAGARWAGVTPLESDDGTIDLRS